MTIMGRQPSGKTYEQAKDFNQILNRLARIPVVRRGMQDEERMALTFSERLIIAETLLPMIEEVRQNERRRQSQD